MKASLLLLVAAVFLAATHAARAQGVSAVIDEALINVTNANHSQIMAILENQLTEAQKQSQMLQQQLDRMGDPRSVNSDSIAMVKEDIQKSASVLKTDAEQRTMISSVTGAEVFNKDAYGLMTPIGSTVTKKDGTVVNRDPAKYKMEAAIESNVDDFNRVYDQAVERKKALSQEIGTLIDQINSAQDLATIAKLNAMLDTVRGQISICDSDILNAKAKADMVEKDMGNQARIITKGKQEEASLTSKGAGPAGGQTPEQKQDYLNSLKRTSKLPWGKKGSDTNPGVGSGTGSGAGTGAGSSVP